MARRHAARRRRSRRFTPRRWLPFIALSALVAGAMVIEPDRATVDGGGGDGSTAVDVRGAPAIAAGDAISTAWFCSGGSGQSSEGVGQLAAVLANDAETGAVADVTVFGLDGPLATEQVPVPAHGRARVSAAELAEGDWVGMSLEVRGGRVAVDREVSGDLGFDATPCTTVGSARWHLPWGSTVRGAELYLSLFNPYPSATSVDIVFATETGRRAPRALQGLTVPAQSLRIVKVSDTVTDRESIATTVRVRSGRLIVDRVQTYDGTGDEIVGVGDDPVTTPAPEGLASTPAISVRAPRWVLPGTRLTAGVRTRIAVFNPSSTVAEVDVVVTHQEPERNPEVEPVQLSVRAGEVAFVDLSEQVDILPDVDVMIDVRSLEGVPVVAERQSVYTEPSPRRGVVIAAAAPIQADRWLLTQAGPTRARSGTVQVANVGTSAAAVRVYQLTGGDRSELEGAAVTVPAGDRRSLAIGDAVAAATLVIEADEPIIVSSTLSEVDGFGISAAPGFAYLEFAMALPSLR